MDRDNFWKKEEEEERSRIELERERKDKELLKQEEERRSREEREHKERECRLIETNNGSKAPIGNGNLNGEMIQRYVSSRYQYDIGIVYYFSNFNFAVSVLHES